MKNFLKIKKTKSYKLKAQRGDIVMPVLFIIIAFAVLMVGGKMVNVSFVDTTEKFSNASTSNDGQKQNLQLKKITFQPKPTPVKSCVADSGKVVDPECMCPDVHYVCKGGKCVDVIQEKSTMKGHSCDDLWGQSACTYPAQDGGRCYGKPVIYLYPTTPTLVDVKVVTSGKIIVSDPIYPENGWKNVLAYPSGELKYQDKYFRELFYETSVPTVTKPSTGIVIESKDLKFGLSRFIQRLGLTRMDEQQEFLDWWIPKLIKLNSTYIFVSLINKDEKEYNDKVEISPKPDSFINFIVYFKPLNTYEAVEPLILPPTPQRIGFTAVEWGGVIDY